MLQIVIFESEIEVRNVWPIRINSAGNKKKHLVFAPAAAAFFCVLRSQIGAGGGRSSLSAGKL